MATVNRTGLAPRALHGVTYDEYVKYRDDPKNAGLRMTYRDGWFVFMSPRYRHERPSAYLAMIVRSTAAVFSIPYLESASTTFRKGKLGTAQRLRQRTRSELLFCPSSRDPKQGHD